MLKGKNLLGAIALVAVGYYVWKMYSKKQMVSAPKSASSEEANASGRYVRPRLNFNRQRGSYNEGAAYSPNY